ATGAVAACLRVPVVGRDGPSGSVPGSSTSWFAGNVLAFGDFAASAKFTRSAPPVPAFFAPWQPTIRSEIRTMIRHSRWLIAASRLEIQRPADIVQPLYLGWFICNRVVATAPRIATNNVAFGAAFASSAPYKKYD